MSKRFNNYVGKAGQLYVMSEFLMLGWNVAIPEVDRGDDIFVVKDSDGDLRRVQVKTAQAKSTRKGYTAQFSLPRQQLITQTTPELYFTLLIRGKDSWKELFVITRTDLADFLAEQLRTVSATKYLTLILSVVGQCVTYRHEDFTAHRQLKQFFVPIAHF